MGCARVFYAKNAEKIDLTKGIFVSSLICIASYIVAIVFASPVISLIGCAVCGIGAGIMWPGSYSLGCAKIPSGGVMMFGMLALAGDFGCMVGPSLTGQAASLFGDNLRIGFAFTLIFPVILAIISFVMYIKNKKAKDNQ